MFVNRNPISSAVLQSISRRPVTMQSGSDRSDHSGLFSGTLTQLLAAVSGTLFAISDGMSYGWTAPIIPYLISEDSHIKTTKQEAEWLETLIMAGSFFSLPLTIYLVDKIGRRRSMLAAAVISLLCWVIIASAGRMLYIFIARFLFGTASNMAFVAAPMYVAEIADHKIRGFLSSIIYLMMLVGFVIVYSVVPFSPFYTVPVIGVVILLTDFSTFYFMPETPYYLVYKNQIKEAKQSLQFLRPGRDIEDELSDIIQAVATQKMEQGRLLDLLTVKSNRKATIIMFVLNGGQHMCAISVVLMNLHLILKEGDSIYMPPEYVAIVFSVIMLVSSQLASLQVDKFGRKILLVVSTVVSGLCLLALAIYFNLKNTGYNVRPVSWIPMAAVMIYAAGFKIGLGIVPIVITAEIFSARVKAAGMTIADAWYVVGSIISLQVYQWLSNAYGLEAPFYLFAVCSFLITLFTIFCIPETKGKTLEEIQMILKGESEELAAIRSRQKYSTFVNEISC
nr:unnamed protein product [Callosobruchus analis]